MWHTTTTFEAPNKKHSNASFTDFVFGHLEKERSSLRRETYYTYKSTATKLLRFKRKIDFKDIDEKFIHEYREWMLRIGNNENTTSKSLRTLRTWINVALRFGMIQKNPFQYIRIKKIDGKRDFLNIEDFNALYNTYLSGKYTGMRQEILRYFLFSCTTGIRYSDIRRLEYSHISDGVIQLMMQKTTLPVAIPLSDKASLIIRPYGAGRCFRTYCNKVTNRILKMIVCDHGIQKKVTFHVARHTFATISITLGIPIEVVSKLLGHTDLKTTQIYTKIVDSVKAKEMTKWNF